MASVDSQPSDFADAEDSPCLECGACCATYRVSFYWSEAVLRGLPDEFTEKVTPFLSCLAGTNQAVPRCTALVGDVGCRVSCSMYEQRPSPCRELQPGEDKCERARARHGLPPLEKHLTGSAARNSIC